MANDCFGVLSFGAMWKEYFSKQILRLFHNQQVDREIQRTQRRDIGARGCYFLAAFWRYLSHVAVHGWLGCKCSRMMASRWVQAGEDERKQSRSSFCEVRAAALRNVLLYTPSFCWWFCESGLGGSWFSCLHSWVWGLELVTLWTQLFVFLTTAGLFFSVTSLPVAFGYYGQIQFVDYQLHQKRVWPKK